MTNHTASRFTTYGIPDLTYGQHDVTFYVVNLERIVNV